MEYARLGNSLECDYNEQRIGRLTSQSNSYLILLLYLSDTFAYSTHHLLNYTSWITNTYSRDMREIKRDNLILAVNI